MSWRDSAQEAVAAIAALDHDTLTRRLTADKLAVLARAFSVRSTGRKALIAEGILARARLLDRMRRLGSDPQGMARTFKRESLLVYAEGLGCFTGLNKYGLAATIIGKRDQIYRSIAADMEAAA